VGCPSIYPEEFRREACELARRGDRSIRQVAAGLGIPDQTLCNWLKAEDEARARGQDPESLSESELSELKRLRKENAELKMDREILLKASVFSPRRRTAKPLPVRLRSPRAVPGQGLVPGGQGLTQRLLRLGRPGSVVSLCRRRLSGRHHQRHLPALEVHLWSASGPRPALSGRHPGRAQMSLREAAAGMAEAQAWKGQQIAKGWCKLVEALRRSRPPSQ
jgi:transposase